MIDTYSLFVNDQGNAIKSLYDPTDPSGVHISRKGAEEIVMAFLEQKETSDDSEPQTPNMSKRKLSSRSPSSAAEKQVLPFDCKDILDIGYNNSGMFDIYPSCSSPGATSAYCDMQTMNGGWT
ncbi:techylectin-5A-like, partial [Saccostrea cucullata]|uniref:techylectin-5A-like n=1 Tax=Saccostrea cuccullata TaxID=36930 RepID=UPI002ED4B3B0